MITNNLDLQDINIIDLFREINYSFYENDGKIIRFGNGYYEIHFYINEKSYYSEDQRNVVRLVIDYCVKNFNDLKKIEKED